jgi:outer membrane protein
MSFITPRLSRAVLGLALAAALTAPLAARAQAPGTGSNIKVAVIDTERVLLASETGKKALADLKKLQEAKENEVKARQQEIKDLQTKLQDGQMSLAKDKISEMEKTLEDKVIALRRLQDDATRELNKKRDDVLAQIDQKVMPVINQAGKDLGYTLIFRKYESGLIYADEAIDITNQIIQRLDGGAPKAGGK